MHSIRTKITFVTVCTILIVIITSALLGVFTIRRLGTENSNQILALLCESGEKNLDVYFSSVEQSVEMVSTYVENDLDGIDDEHLQAHLARVENVFNRLTYKTMGVLTYYYRIDPAISSNVKGFWYVNSNDSFVSHEVTDISLYDTDDTGALVWFTVPKKEGKSVWLPPYITENLGMRVISYNVPVYYEEQFIGVIGIEIDYSTMAEQVDNITLFDNGYAFINDDSGKIIYHPKMDVTTMKVQPSVPSGLLKADGQFVRYKFEGVEKQAVWIALRNGMRLNVTVPVSEINQTWINWIIEILIIFGILLIAFTIIIIQFSNYITKPLRELTKTAEEVDKGNYDCKLDYNRNDEVGVLTKTFKKLIEHLKLYINDLNDRAYTDSLTSLHNKGAFDVCLKICKLK